jgi:hypothetical protein
LRESDDQECNAGDPQSDRDPVLSVRDVAPAESCRDERET